MTFLERLQNKLDNQRGSKDIKVDRRDIEELMFHFKRLDEEIRVENKRTNMTIMETKLCKIIDEIDTASDIYKPNNKSSYVQFIYKKVTESRKLFWSDGNKLFKMIVNE